LDDDVAAVRQRSEHERLFDGLGSEIVRLDECAAIDRDAITVARRDRGTLEREHFAVDRDEVGESACGMSCGARLPSAG